MFEKEAKERAEKLEKNQTLGIYDNDEDLALDKGFNDGEVYGYEEGFQEGAEFAYNKANEWHYPSKGEYPKDEKNVLCILGDFENINLEVGYYSQKENERERWRFSEYSTPDDSEDAWGVSAWKEVVLPGLKESR